MNTSHPQIFVVEAHDNGARLDRFLTAHLPGASRRSVRKLLAQGAVRVDGRKRAKGSTLSQGQQVQIAGDARIPKGPDQWSPTPNPDLEIPVIYADDDLIAVNKPAGIPCHPLRSKERDTVANGMIARFPELAQAGDVGREAGLLHRLDTPTTGVLVFARRRQAFADLAGQIRGRSAHKTYLALVEGDASWLPERIEFPLLSKRRKVVALTNPTLKRPSAIQATTWIESHRPMGEHTLVTARIHAGKRHQIRAHLAAAGWPIVGDELYDAAPHHLGRPLLHALRMELTSPSTGAPLIIDAPLPGDLQALLSRLDGADGVERGLGESERA